MLGAGMLGASTGVTGVALAEGGFHSAALTLSFWAFMVVALVIVLKEKTKQL